MPSQTPSRRSTIGKFLVGFAVLAPSLLVLGVYLALQDRMYGYHFRGPLWPYIAGDAVILGVGMLLLRGQEL